MDASGSPNRLWPSLLYRRFIKKITHVPQHYICALLRFPLADASRATVRADLYYYWHCARHGGIGLDLLDDLLHALQSVTATFTLVKKRTTRYLHL